MDVVSDRSARVWEESKGVMGRNLACWEAKEGEGLRGKGEPGICL